MKILIPTLILTLAVAGGVLLFSGDLFAGNGDDDKQPVSEVSGMQDLLLVEPFVLELAPQPDRERTHFTG